MTSVTSETSKSPLWIKKTQSDFLNWEATQSRNIMGKLLQLL